MSEQPKPLSMSSDDERTYREQLDGRAYALDRAALVTSVRAAWAEVDATRATLDAERARADAAERRANAYERVLNEIAQEGCGCDEGIPYRCPSCRANDLDLTKEVMPHAGADHSETPELHAVTGAAHPNHAEQSAHWQGCEHAHHGCALALLEDWQECAGHLALVLRTLPDDPINYKEVRKALAEFDRLASEATKGETP